MRQRKNLIISVLFFCSLSFAFGLEEREGFFKQLSSPGGELFTETVLTVPQGKTFVILQMLCRDPDERWELKIDDEVIFNHNIFGWDAVISSNGNAIAANFDITFPDRCVTVAEGKALVFETDQYCPGLTIIGYFYDTGDCPQSDLTGDCKVNLKDLAIMASEWLEGETA